MVGVKEYQKSWLEEAHTPGARMAVSTAVELLPRVCSGKGPEPERTIGAVHRSPGQGLVVQEVLVPAKVPVQPVGMVKLQTPSEEQQAPAQGLGEQTPAAVKTPLQLAWKPRVQAVPMQQLPVAGQAVAPQMALSPW